MNLCNGSNPVAFTVGSVVTPRTVIYAEGLGAELVPAEPVLLDVGFTVDPMRRKVSATDYAQVFAADMATNEVDAFISLDSGMARFRTRITIADGRFRLHLSRRYIRLRKPASQSCWLNYAGTGSGRRTKL